MDFVFENCDYRKLVKKISKENIKIDLLLTDPPYCLSRKHQLGFSNMGRYGMNYGNWDYNFDQKKWIKICSPIIREGGSIIIFNDWKNLSHIVEVLLENDFVIKDLLRWIKKNPMPRNVNSRYATDFEVAIWAVKGSNKKWTFNKPNEIPYLKPEFYSGIVPGGKRRIHPTQKQLSVIEDILKIHSNINDLVFDPFSGSGTTALACKKLSRRFIGSEIDKNYYERAVKRIWL